MAKHITKAARPRARRTSQRQTAANRGNARHSTGPRTPEGKQRSAQNALKHGILAMCTIHPELVTEEQFQAYQDHRESYFEALRPQDQVQADLVDLVVGNRWRMARLLEFEDAAAYRECERFAAYQGIGSEEVARVNRDYVKLAVADLDHPMLPGEFDAALLLRYRGALNSEYFRALAELRRLKRDRAAASAEQEADCAAEPAGEGSPRKDDGINSVRTKSIYQTNPIAENSSQNAEFSGIDYHLREENPELASPDSAPIDADPPRSDPRDE